MNALGGPDPAPRPDFALKRSGAAPLSLLRVTPYGSHLCGPGESARDSDGIDHACAG